MISYTSNLRYVTREVKTAMVDRWAPRTFQTNINYVLDAAMRSRSDIAGIKWDVLAKMKTKKRVWFTPIYLIFDPFVIDYEHDSHFRGVMSEEDFLIWKLSTLFPPLPYSIVEDVHRDFVEKMCKEYIKVFDYAA